MMDDYISASEISEYLYCRRAWWYRGRKIQSANQPIMDRGTSHHNELAATVQRVEQRSRFGWRLFLAGLLLLILFLILRTLLGAG